MTGRRRNELFEAPLKMRLVGKSGGQSDIGNGVACTQLRTAEFNPAIELIGVRSKAVHCLECPYQMRGRKIRLGADVLQSE